MRIRILLVIIAIFLTACRTNKYKIATIENSQIKDSLAKELCQIYGFDQGIRLYGVGGAKNMQKIDSINYLKIVSFIKDNGFPSKNTLGEFYKGECVELAAIAVLLHNPQRVVKNKLDFELLYNEVKNQNISMDNFILILDRYYILKKGNNQRLYYGSQLGMPCIQDKKISDSLRANIGLSPLKLEQFKDCK